MSNGKIIILNGPSSSGKSSIQRALQKLLPELYLKIGIDSFFDALIENPDLSSFESTKSFAQYSPEGELIRSVALLQDPGGNQIVPLTIGPAGQRIISGMHHAIAAYASRGNNIIVDYILYDPLWLEDLLQATQNHKVYMIGVHAPLAVIEEREKSRGTSPIGHSRSHYDTVHRGVKYDLEIDTSSNTPEECAALIAHLVAHQSGKRTGC